MLAQLLALSAAFTLAVGVVLTRKEINKDNFFSFIIILTIIGNILVWPLIIVFPPKGLNMEALTIFIIVGFLHPGFARILYFLGMTKVGASINASIFAIYPLISTLFAMFILNEQPTTLIWLGIFFVIIGSIFIQNSIHKRESMHRSVSVPSLLAMIIAGFAYTLKKMGVSLCKEPLLATAITYLISLIIYLSIVSFSQSVRNNLQIDVNTFKLFWKGSVCLAIGAIIPFYALMYGNVSTVTPLLQTEPLFILLFSYIFLKAIERISKGVVIGTFMIVTGVILITFLST
ncbi:MAG: EamA family transporter [Nitrososphaerota archaeon]|nr:EamA family transporter [Nitrososphaerota archaeon]